MIVCHGHLTGVRLSASPLAPQSSIAAPLAAASASSTAAASAGTPNCGVLRANACSTRRAPRPALCVAGCKAWRDGRKAELALRALPRVQRGERPLRVDLEQDAPELHRDLRDSRTQNLLSIPEPRAFRVAEPNPATHAIWTELKVGNAAYSDPLWSQNQCFRVGHWQKHCKIVFFVSESTARPLHSAEISTPPRT